MTFILPQQPHQSYTEHPLPVAPKEVFRNQKHDWPGVFQNCSNSERGEAVPKPLLRAQGLSEPHGEARGVKISLSLTSPNTEARTINSELSGQGDKAALGFSCFYPNALLQAPAHRQPVCLLWAPELSLTSESQAELPGLTTR